MFCTKCGKPNDDDALFCEFCGAKIEEQAPPEPIPAPAPVQLFCEKCGKPNEPDALFCEFCGAKFEEGEAVAEMKPEPIPEPEPAPEPVPVQAVAPAPAPIPEPAPKPSGNFCEKCGKPNEPDALFCEFCGAKFEEEEAVVEVKPEPAPKPVPEPEPVQAVVPAPAPIPEPAPKPAPAPSASPKNPEKRKKVGIIAAIASAAAVIVAVIIIVLVNCSSVPEGGVRMKMNGKSIPVEMAAFDIPSSAPTVYLCGKTNNGAYICTVTFKTLPAANSDYSASDASVTIAYSGKDTKASNGAHQYALLSTDTTKISVGEYQWGDTIELTVEGKTNPDVYKDYEGTLVFNISGTASFDNGASGALADWKKDNIIPD